MQTVVTANQKGISLGILSEGSPLANPTVLIVGGIAIVLAIFLFTNQSGTDGLSQATKDDIKNKLNQLLTTGSYASNFSHIEVLAQFKDNNVTNNIVVNLVGINMPQNFNSVTQDLSLKTNILTLSGNVAYATEVVKILRNDLIKKTEAIRVGRLGGADALDTKYNDWINNVKTFSIQAQNPIINQYLIQIRDNPIYYNALSDASEALAAIQTIGFQNIAKAEVRAATVANPGYSQTATTPLPATMFKMEVKIFKKDNTTEIVNFTRPAPMSTAITLVLAMAADPDIFSGLVQGALPTALFQIAFNSSNNYNPGEVPTTRVFVGRLGAEDPLDSDYIIWRDTLLTSLGVKAIPVPPAA